MKKNVEQKVETMETGKETKKEKREIIVDILPVENKNGEITHIDIVLDDGTSFPVPNTKPVLLHFRDIMLKQVKEQKELIETKKKSVNACTVIAIAGVAGVVLANTTQIGKEIGALTPSIISGTIALGSGIGAIVESKKLSRLQRNVTFACHRKEINESICNNPYIYLNVCKKDKSLIESWLDQYRGEPIVIENLDKLEPTTIHEIWRNINLYKQFGLQYKADGKIEEPGFQKILEQPKEKEQSN